MVRRHVPLLLLCCLLASCAAVHEADDQGATDKDAAVKNAPDPNPATLEDVRDVRQTLAAYQNSVRCKAGYMQHIEPLERRLEGERRFAACEMIIAAPENPEDLEFALSLLCGAKGDRSRFIEPARKALAHEDGSVRCKAALLLGEIGTPNEGSALVALLSDENHNVIWEAVAALARIGGPNELIALDAWLGRLSPDDVGWRSSIKERREAFAARLRKEGQLPAKGKP